MTLHASQCVRNRGCERRQDGALAQMKTVRGYVFLAIFVHVCMKVCAHVLKCTFLCMLWGESNGVCNMQQHAAGDRSYGGKKGIWVLLYKSNMTD